MSLIHFHTALGGSILRLWRGPSPRAYSWSGCTLFSFHSALRIHPAPLARPFSKGLLQGPTHGADSLSFPFIPPWGIHPAPLARPFSKGLLMVRMHSLFLSFCLGDPSCAFGAALLQGPTHGADSLSFPFIPPRGSILRLWRGPSPRAYSWCGFTLFSFHSALRIHPVPLTRPFSQSQPPTPPKGKEPAFADSFPRSCFQP